MVEKSRKTPRFRLAFAALLFGLLIAACSGSSDSVLPTNVDDDSDSADDADGNTAGDVEDTSGGGNDGGGNTDSSIATRSTELRPEGSGLAISVDRVSDGDSVRASSSEGDLEIRLIGINAPEQDECFGSEAGAQLEQLLDATDVTLHPWPPELDDFGRELGFLVADGVFVNLSLVETGHVLARAQSDHDFINEFDVAEDAASAAGVGLWAADACGEAVDGDLEIIEVFEDAPGDDRENPNGEFVILENVGDTAVQMERWGLRDESTRHRYTFPSVLVEPGERVQIRTGCGNDDLGSDPIELFWCDPEPPVWNNGGDLALLLDPNGAIVSDFVVTG